MDDFDGANYLRVELRKLFCWNLGSEKFLLLHEVHCLSVQVCQLLEDHHLHPDLVLRGAQLVTIARLVAAGLGVSVVPQMMVASEFATGCVAVPFTPPVPTRELNLLRNPLRFEGKAAATFRQEATAALHALGLTRHAQEKVIRNK